MLTYEVDGEFRLPGEKTDTGLRPTPRLFITDSGVRWRFLESAFSTTKQLC